MCTMNEGREFKSDTARLIHKFDVYFCDLGEIGDNHTLGKTRPCVIVSSDDLNDPRSGQYMIAPIRTEHSTEVTEDNIEEIVAEKIKLGRLYIPILINPADGYRFIDITQLRQISSSDVLSYKGTIINDKVRERINMSLMKLLFSSEEVNISTEEENTEVASIANICTHMANGESTIVRDSEIIPTCTICGQKFHDYPVTVKEVSKGETGICENTFLGFPVNIKEVEEPKKRKTKRKSSFPMGFSKYFQLYQKGDLTISQVAEKLGSPRTTVYYQIKRYAELHPELVTSK